MAAPWTEKYRPRRLDQVSGNPQALAELRTWAESWKEGIPKVRTVILAGPPGCGKTSAAHALSEEYGWGLIELNASDARSAGAIKRVAGEGSLHETFSPTGEFFSTKRGQRKLIVLDEADNLYERAGEDAVAGGEDFSDRGGKRAIVETVVNTRQPIVLIANDGYALTRGMGERLTKAARVINFRRLPAPTVKRVLKEVAAAEGVIVSDDVLTRLVSQAEGDLRSAVNDLEAVASGRARVDLVGDLPLADRNRTASVFGAVATILKTTDARKAIKAARDVDEPPDFLLAWVDENMPQEYRNPRDLMTAYDLLSRADVFLGRTMRRQHYGLWGYATELLSGGVAAAKSQPYGTPPRYQFPSWIRRMGASKGQRGTRDAVAAKLGGLLHVGRHVATREFLPWIRSAMARDREFAESLSLRADLDEDEIRYLLAGQAPDSYIDEVVAHVEKQRAALPGSQAQFVVHEAPEEQPAPTSAKGRRATLGDF